MNLIERNDYRCYGAYDPQTIIRMAVRAVGLEGRAFLSIFRALGGSRSLNFSDDRGHWDHIGIDDWILLCRLLHLSLDCFGYGYCAGEHRFRVGDAVFKGTYLLPQTDLFQPLKGGYVRRLREETRFERGHYGDRLLRIVFKQKAQKRQQLRAARKLERERLRPFRASILSWYEAQSDSTLGIRPGLRLRQRTNFREQLLSFQPSEV